MTDSLLDDRTNREVADFLMREAELLDERHFGEWLDLLTDDIHYNMPVRVTRGSEAASEFVP